MRLLWLLLLSCSFATPAEAALYRHVDASGNVTYSDRPQAPNQDALRLPPPNVATPEARRQLVIARQVSEREQQAEHEARMRQWAAANRAAPAYSRALTPNTPRYAAPVYYSGYAGMPAQGNTAQGLRPAGVSHRAHHPRR